MDIDNRALNLANTIRNISDFPEKGIVFRDITPILQNKACLHMAVDLIGEQISGFDFDLIVAPESRGFIFGMPVAYNLNKGFIPVRKAGKLPFDTVSKTYDLEYGTATIELHKDAIKPGQRVAIVDDLLATGGTCRALCDLVTEIGGIVVTTIFLMELLALNGRKVLDGYDVQSIITY